MPATATREKPIIFSGPMVRSILEGRKRQTRRIITPQFGKTWGQGVRLGDDAYSVHVDIQEPNGEWKWLRCPYGKPGDRLWVRETWANITSRDATECIAYRADRSGREVLRDYGGEGDFVGLGKPCEPWIEDGTRWKPSIHMPRKYARIFLRLTDVRVERLNEISEADAIAEGVGTLVDPDLLGTSKSIKSACFATLWDSLHGAGSWSANPWVWVISFQRESDYSGSSD